MKNEFKTILDYISKHKKLDRNNYKKVCKIHSEVFNHKYHEPCTCNPRTVNQWVKELKNYFEL